jgi:spoIIIJ-associated protein
MSTEKDEELSNTISDEDLDNIADTAISIIQEIIPFFLINDITIDEYEGDEGELILDITGDDIAVLIGRHGKTLEALQTMVSTITMASLNMRYPLILDVEGYKNRQRDKLENIALSAASKAIKQKRDIHLNPMSPYERRLIHMALSNNKKVKTESEGEGNKRHVVVSLI